MKKFIAIVLSLVIALSCSAMAFAQTTYTCPTCKKVYTDNNLYNACIDKHASEAAAAAATATAANTLKCHYCGNTFTDGKTYNEHILICEKQRGYVDGEYTPLDSFVNLNLNDIFTKLLDFSKLQVDWTEVLNPLIIRIIDLVENIGTLIAGEADVAGAIDDLEAKIAELPIVGDILEYVKSLITSLKQKIKDLYAGNKETTIEETTAAEEPVETGSSAVGIAAFAAVSVAAAAAYVCTKKKD